jgi:PKD repeat protein
MKTIKNYHKNLLILLCAMFLISVAIYSCKKDFIPDSMQGIDNIDRTEHLTPQGLNFSCGPGKFYDMLDFPTRACYDDVYEELKRENDAVGDTTQDSCIEDPVLQYYEGTINFISLRRHIQDLHCMLLANGTDPNDLPEPWEDDEVSRTLLNIKYQIKIGEEIFWQRSPEEHIIITDANYSTLQQIEAGADPTTFSNVIYKDYRTTGGLYKGACGVDWTGEYKVNSTAEFQVTVDWSNCNSPIRSIQTTWNFGDLTPEQTKPGTNKFLHDFKNPGDYKVKAKIRRICGTDTCYEEIPYTVSIGGCSPWIKYSGYDKDYTFDSDLSKSEFDPNMSYQWNFGDPGSPDNTSTDPDPSHRFSDYCNYTVSLTIFSGDCPSGKTKTAQINVRQPGDHCWFVLRRGFSPKGGLGTDGDLMIKFKYHLGYNTIMQNVFNARMRCFKHKSNGGYKKSKQELQILTSGNINDEDEADKSNGLSCPCRNPRAINTFPNIPITKKHIIVKEEFNTQFERTKRLRHADPITVRYFLNGVEVLTKTTQEYDVAREKKKDKL